MGANSSSHRQKRRRSQLGQHYPASQHSLAGQSQRHHRHHRRHHQYNNNNTAHHSPSLHHQNSRASSWATLDTMASTSSHRRNSKSASTRTLLDKKCIFLGRYFARQFSQPVLQRLRYHVQRAKGTKTRLRLSTNGLTVGSKNNNVFKPQKAPYEFLPFSDIHEIFVDNDLRSLLLVIKGLPDGHLELLTYKLTDELEARLYQQTFNEMAARDSNRAIPGIHQRLMETTAVDGTIRSGTGIGAGRSQANYYTTHTSQSGTLNRKAGNSWSRAATPNEAYIYRLKNDGYGSGPGTPATLRHTKNRHRSDGDVLDEELRKQAEDREFLNSMRQREMDDDDDMVDGEGPIRLVFNRDGVIETHGAASIVRDGEDSYFGSDHDSGIQSKDAHPDVVDSGLGTVRAKVGDYSMQNQQQHLYSATRTSSSSQHHTSGIESYDQTDHGGYGNGYVTGRSSRSPTRGSSSGLNITHHVKRSESPAPSHQSRAAQSEGGWRMRLPWKRRSRSSDSHAGSQHHVWETTSLMVGSHPRPLGKMYVPHAGVENPPEYLVMYPSLNKTHRTKSKSASRFEL